MQIVQIDRFNCFIKTHLFELCFLMSIIEVIEIIFSADIRDHYQIVDVENSYLNHHCIFHQAHQVEISNNSIDKNNYIC
jgi:hypothetical protein